MRMGLTGTHARGILLATTLGLLAHGGAAYMPSALNGILLALLSGIVVGNLIRLPADFQPGVGFTSSKLLELSILFLAFSINYTHITQLGLRSFTVVAITVIVMLFITYRLARVVRCPGSTGWLVGFGTAICGSSAIAALAPGVTKDKGDVGIAMAVVNLLGSMGMIIMPIVLMRLDLGTAELGLLVGGTLHSVGNVVGAGYALNDTVGEAAITIKLARVALLSPALILFNAMVNRKRVGHWREHFSLPWYLWGFICITVVTSVVQLPAYLLATLETSGKLVLTIAMAAIGLKVSFRELYHSGRKGIGFGIMVFCIQAVLVGLLMCVLL
jgi:uncharacterized integral membrane protein (TIGR00698 family)